MFDIGDRVSIVRQNDTAHLGDTAVVVYNRTPGPINSFKDCILIKFDKREKGWVGGNHITPEDAPHLIGVSGLYWIHPGCLAFFDNADRFEIDE